MEIKHIWGVQKIERPSNAIWEVWSTNQDGKTWVDGFPHGLQNHIAAAYSIDVTKPTAADEVMDIILYRGRIEDPAPDGTRASDALRSAGMMTTLKVDTKDAPKGAEVPVSLYTADSHAHARDALMVQLEEVKRRVKYVPMTSVDPKTLRGSAAQMFLVTSEIEKKPVTDPLDVWRKGHGMTVEDVIAHRLAVTSMRRSMHGLSKVPNAHMALNGVGEPARMAAAKPDGDESMARRWMAMYLDKENPDVRTVPQWVIDALTQPVLDKILIDGEA